MAKETEIAIERRLNLFLWAVLTAVAVWIGSQVTTQAQAIVRLETQQNAIQDGLNRLLDASQDRFTSTQATAMESRWNGDVNELEDRVHALEINN